jgi:hypothetical protein
MTLFKWVGSLIILWIAHLEGLGVKQQSILGVCLLKCRKRTFLEGAMTLNIATLSIMTLSKITHSEATMPIC